MQFPDFENFFARFRQALQKSLTKLDALLERLGQKARVLWNSRANRKTQIEKLWRKNIARARYEWDVAKKHYGAKKGHPEDKLTRAEEVTYLRLNLRFRPVKIIANAACAVIAAGAILGGYVHFANQIEIDPDKLGKDIVVAIAPGTPASSVVDILEKNGVHVNSLFFKISLRVTGADRNLKTGYYRIVPGETVMQLTERLARGDAVLLSWRIADGSTYWEVRRSLNATEGLKHDSESMSADAILLAIGAKEGHLEGLFAPDTYHFHAGVSDLQVLKAAYDRQQEILTEEWTNRGTNCAVKSPYEALILASIVEREVARSEDRLIVAGIFSNRLRIKMPLQTDPSVIYGEGEDFEGRLRRKHLDRDTPYNTYRFVGLPPTPIGNPTRASIHAVMHPAKTPYLYFINKENGDLVASRTLQEHNRAVNRYIRKKGQ